MQASVRDAFRLEPRLESGDRFVTSGDHGVFRCIDRGDRHVGRQLGRDGVCRRADAEHCAGGHGLHQARAARDEHESVVEVEGAADARGDVFADAVADHRIRLHAPRHPELRQRVLDREQRRLRDRGLRQLRLRAVAVRSLG